MPVLARHPGQHWATISRADVRYLILQETPRSVFQNRPEGRNLHWFGNAGGRPSESQKNATKTTCPSPGWAVGPGFGLNTSGLSYPHFPTGRAAGTGTPPPSPLSGGEFGSNSLTGSGIKSLHRPRSVQPSYAQVIHNKDPPADISASAPQRTPAGCFAFMIADW